jgi:hypothetical protein
VHDSAWSNDLTVEVGGHGVVSHAGSAVLRLLADRTGLTGALSRAVRRRGFTPVHDRSRVLADAARADSTRRLVSWASSPPSPVNCSPVGARKSGT